MARRRLVVAVLAAALLPLAAAVASAQDASQKTTAATKPGAVVKGKRMIICRGAPIPPGWVLVDDLRDSKSCGGENPAVIKLYNVWSVENIADRPSGSTMNVCAANPTPAGWTVVDVYRDMEFCGHPEESFGLNVKKIRKL
jgi:hypothetical protein